MLLANPKQLQTANKLSFESEKLVVDYISFNIQGLVDRKQVERIAKYFFQTLGFNSTFAKGSTGKEEDLFFDFRNQYRVSFDKNLDLMPYTDNNYKLR